MADAEGMITEIISIRDTIKPGLSVYDREAKIVGTVWQIHRVPGYFTVQVHPLPQKMDNPFGEKYLHIPFSLITSIDPRELFLSISRDEVRRDYASPPPRSTRIEEEYGGGVAVTTEPSGYDGTPIVGRRARIDELTKYIEAGDRVYSSDPTELGTIKHFDPATGWMQITRDTLLNEPTLRVPVAIVDAVNRNKHEVYLVWSQADLQRMEHLEPA